MIIFYLLGGYVADPCVSFAVWSAGNFLAAIFGPRCVFVDDIAACSQIEIHDAVLFLHVGLVGLGGAEAPPR